MSKNHDDAPDRSVLDLRESLSRETALAQLDIKRRQLSNLIRSGAIRTVGEGHSKRFTSESIAKRVGYERKKAMRGNEGQSGTNNAVAAAPAPASHSEHGDSNDGSTRKANPGDRPRSAATQKTASDEAG